MCLCSGPIGPEGVSIRAQSRGWGFGGHRAPEGGSEGPWGERRGDGRGRPHRALGGGLGPSCVNGGTRGGVALMGRDLGRWELGLLCGGPPALSLPWG